MFTAVQDFDFRLFKILNSLVGKSQTWDLVFTFLSEYVIFFMVAGLAVFVLLKKEKLRSLAALQALAAAFIGRAIITSILRIFFFRARPFVAATVLQLVYHNPAEGSFPSGHAVFMFSLAFSLFFTNPRWGIFYFLLAILSSISRVIAGVHFPLDIIGGLFIAALSAFLAKWLFWGKLRFPH